MTDRFLQRQSNPAHLKCSLVSNNSSGSPSSSYFRQSDVSINPRISCYSSDSVPSSPNKTSYRYEKINSSFRLVETDSNKENHDSLFLQNQESKDSHYCKLLLTVNSLSERLTKLEKQRSYEQQKGEFELHSLVERVVTQQINLENKRKEHYLEEQLQAIKAETASNCQAFAQLQVKFQKYCSQQQVKNEEALAKNNMLVSEEMQNKLKEEVKRLEEDLLAVLQQKQEDMLEEISAIMKKVKSFELKAQPQELTNEVASEIIANIYFQSIIRSKNGGSSSEVKQFASYGIDPEGYLLDDQNRYLLTSQRTPVKLTSEQLSRLKSIGVLQPN